MGKSKAHKNEKRGKRKANDEATRQDDDKPAKRAKLYTDDNAKLAHILGRLSDEKTEERESATKELFDFVETQDTEKLHKVLVRLTRGLCSGRKAARFGYAVALTHVLEQLYGSGKQSEFAASFAVWQVIDLIFENVQTPQDSKLSGQERRDYALGRLFAYTAITESKILSDSNDRRKLLESILQLAAQEAHLREECGKSICKWVTCIPETSDQAEKEIATIFDQLQSNGLLKLSEGIAFWLTVKERFPKVGLPQGIWHKDDPLNKKERSTLATLLRGGLDDSDDSHLEATNGAFAKTKKAARKMKPSPTQYKPHFAWEVVFTSVTKRQEETNEKEDTPGSSADLAKFWVEVVDNGLFSEAASMVKKMLGFQLLGQRLKQNPIWALRCLFTTNLRRCLINQRKDSGRYLHTAAKASLSALQARIVSEPDAAAPIVLGLVSEEKKFANFDQLSGSKTVASAMTEASDSALSEITAYLLDEISTIAKDDAVDAEKLRRLLADLIVQALRNRKSELLESSIQAEDSWLHKVLDVFVQLAYFVPTSETKHRKPSPALDEGSRKMFQSRLSSCLAAVLGAKVDESMAMPYYITSRLRKYRKSNSLELALQAEKSVLKTIKSAQSVVEDVALREKEAKGSQKTLLRAFKLLFSLTIIQAYNGEPDAVDLLDELQACYEPVSAGSADQDAFDVLIEVILGCVSKPSLLFRNAGEQAFKAFASELSSNSLESMLDILSKKEGAAGQEELFEQEPEAGEEDEGSDVDMKDASDVEVINGSDAEDGAEEESSESEDEEEDAKDDEEEDDEELARFENLLAQTLKTSKPNGTGAVDEEASDDDADMDDEEMMALEPHLTQIFKERKKVSKQNSTQVRKDAKDSVVNFKNRVLDLLNIYLKQEYHQPLALSTILPLTRLVRTTGSAQVSAKAFDLLRHYFDTCRLKKAIPTPTNIDDMWTTLSQIHQEALKGTASKQHSHACSRSSLFIVRVLTQLDRNQFGRAEKQYSETRIKWWEDKKIGLSVSFFVEWDNWAGEVRRLV